MFRIVVAYITDHMLLIVGDIENILVYFNHNNAIMCYICYYV